MATRIAKAPPFGGDDMAYVEEWQRFAKPFEIALGWSLIAFDPDLCFGDVDGNRHDITMAVAVRLRPYLEDAEGEDGD